MKPIFKVILIPALSIATLAAVSISAPDVQAQTRLGGAIKKDTRQTKDKSPYVLY